MISVRAVSFSYGELGENNKRVIDDVSFDIEKGEFVALIGANGSGKSTLAMLLNGVYMPGSGRISVDNLNISNSEEHLKAKMKIAVLFQNPSEHLVSGSVESDIAFTLENYGIPPSEIRERVDEALVLFGLGEFRTKHPRHLSGGEQQKIAFAGIWALKPNYIICDEVTTYLDHSSRKLIIELLRDFRKGGGGVLFITQFPIEALHADRLLLLNNGKIRDSCIPSDLLRDENKMSSSGHTVPKQLLLDELMMNFTNGYGRCSLK